jgi:mannosyl-oligosaccharide alpha-1,2-mannosidase
MGFSDEYNLCRPHVNQLNFNWVGGRDWSRGFVSEAPATDDDETPAETWAVQRDRGVALPVFETGIRYLGGLLGAYDLSGDQLLVDRAVDLADVLGRAFNTDSGLPAGRIDPGSASGVYRLGTVSIAEVGSMSLELIRLSQITGNRTWFDLAERAMDYLEQKVIPRGDPVIQPLLPLWINPDAGPGSSLNGAFSFGGLADSYYEYLIKTYKLLGGGRVAERWKRIYEQSVTKAQGILFVEVDVVPEHDLLAIGKWEYGRLIPEIEHLTCFAGAMLGLGAKLLDRTKDMVHAERFTQSCYWLSAATHTGLQPESVQFYNGESDKGVMYEHVLKSGKAYHPKTFTPDMVHEYGDGIMRWNVDGQPVKPEEGGEFTDDDEVVAKKLKGTPPGTKVVNGRGINRPETIESIFYM